MKYDSKEMERQTILNVAFGMCTAERTAPKGRGMDSIRTAVLTGEEKEEKKIEDKKKDVVVMIEENSKEELNQEVVLTEESVKEERILIEDL